MTFEAQLWREVCKHPALDDSVRRIAPILAEHLPLDLVLVRRFERDPVRLTTVAIGACQPEMEASPLVARSECPDFLAPELDAWLGSRRITQFQTDSGSMLCSVLVPPGVRGTVIAGPLAHGGRPVGVAVLVAAPGRGFEPAHLEAAENVIELLGVAFENDERMHELARMREALEADRQALLSRLGRQDISEVVIGEHGGLSPVMERVEQVAPTDAPVLILGETGSGKEVIARAIHARSRRAKGPVVRINCGAIPPELIDSELFGHERGSFTGAVSSRKGWFERADGGTLFLDEIGELPPAAQVRLLRVLQDGTLERVGGHQPIAVDVRLVAATHRHLETMVAEGGFREDLWYRISVFPIRLPALRERMEDIPALAAHFASHAGKRLGGMALTPSAADIALLRGYNWPGNVRELAAVIERAAILGNGKHLEIAKALGAASPPTPLRPATPLHAAAPLAEPFPLSSASASAASGHAPIATLDEAMVAHIERALAATHGQIEGRHGAAALLGINPHTLRARMRKLRIDWTRFRPHTPPTKLNSAG